MAISPYKTFADGETLTAADLNSSFLQITNGGQAVPFPRTTSADFDGYELIIDADADSSITADTDDLMDFRLQGQDLFKLDGTTASAVNGLTVLMGATLNAPQVKAHGSDTNIGMTLVPKGTGAFTVTATTGSVVMTATTMLFDAATSIDIDGCNLILDADADSSLRETSDDVIALKLQGVDAFIFDGDAASAANGLTFQSAANAADVVIQAQGSSTDVNVKLASKGSGVVKINSSTVTATPTASAVPIADSSGKLDSWTAGGSTLIATYTPSAVASLDLTSVITATYDVYTIDYQFVPVSDGVSLNTRTDSNNGASFDSGAGNYAHHFLEVTATGTVTGGGSASSSQIATTTTSIGNATNEGVAGRFVIHFRGSGTRYPVFSWSQGYLDTGTLHVFSAGGFTRLSAAAIDAIQFYFSTGNIASGTARIYGQRIT